MGSNRTKHFKAETRSISSILVSTHCFLVCLKCHFRHFLLQKYLFITCLFLTCKVAHKCLNVREWVEVIEWNKKRSPPFPCCPVSCQCPWKKTLIGKKKRKKYLSYCNHVIYVMEVYPPLHKWHGYSKINTFVIVFLENSI